MSLSKALGGVAHLNTGYVIPMIGLGTYKITGQQTVRDAVDAALQVGYRMFDTAKYYVNEPELGNALQELLPKHKLRREDIFITTKFFPSTDNNAEYSRRMVEESLGNLKTDYLDLVLVHYPKADASDNADPRNAQHRKDCYLELEKLKEEQKIRSVGVSNYEIRHIEEIKKFGKMMPAVNQVEYHPHFTRAELRDYCIKEGIFFQAFSSLARQNPDLIGDPTITSTALTHETTPQMVLLAWALAMNVGIVPKSSTPSRVIENFGVINLQLSPEEVKKIRTLNRDKHYIRCDGWNVL